MNLNEIEAKCFIMALFIRDDGLRFLLGSGAYEFKDSQLMFAGNTIENDVVAVQGNDGYMLAGQVRRPSTQVFDGYIGDASVPKSEVEGYRRDFMAFFQKNHFYTVVYVMADGSAIQRRRGFLVDAPTSQELWQMYPEYHVALNFEDVNYYKYSENDDGEETYAKSADIGLAKVQYGGLIWDNDSEIEISGSGTNITLAGTMEGGAIESVELNGDTEQTTYSGKNLCDGINQEYWLTSAATGAGVSSGNSGLIIPVAQNTRYTISTTTSQTRYRVAFSDSVYTSTQLTCYNGANRDGTSDSITRSSETHSYLIVNATDLTKIQVEEGNQATSFEPYVGGTASPNPDYPQEVQTVTGRQVVTITDGGSESQEYEINLGKNILDNIGVTETKAGGITFTVNADKSVTVSGVATGANWFKLSEGLQLDGDYFLSGCPSVGGTTTFSLQTSYSGTVYGDYGSGVQLHAGTTDPVWIVVRQGQDFSTPVTFYPQIEKGSAATTYAPYFTPIELCKIGDYQDYIYKSGEDWYIHKDLAKVVLDGSDTSNYGTLGNGTGGIKRFRYSRSDIGNVPDDIRTTYCDIYQGIQRRYTLDIQNSISQYTQQNMLNITTSSTTYTLNDYLSFLSSNPATVYYVLATPTDTQITNATLISELEDLLSATTYSGNTYITVSGDLASPLEVKAIAIGGGGVEWDANGAVWEAGGGGEIVIVNVDSIENIFPVWTIRGEAENPTLTNLTTGMSITYNGTVASGQTLVIDLLNKTAKLNGTSVISDVSGQWVEFKPGNNRVSYSTENANAPDSTIEWQEVVG